MTDNRSGPVCSYDVSGLHDLTIFEDRVGNVGVELIHFQVYDLERAMNIDAFLTEAFTKNALRDMLR